MSALSPSAARRLATRAPLEVDPGRPAAIKRNQHEIVVSAGADAFARALKDVLSEPDVRFGPIAIKRPADRVGAPFAAGERFTGCVRLFGRLGRLGVWLDDRVASDYAEIVVLEPRRVVYRYLAGSPIAGESTFAIEELGPDRSLLRATFAFQEVGGLAVTVLHRFGLRLHDEVTREQSERAARRLGAVVLSSTLR